MDAVKRIVPKGVRQRMKSVLAYPDTIRLAADGRTFRAIRRLENSTTRWPATVETVPLRLKALEGGTLHVRPNTSDTSVLRDSFFDRSHMPPGELAGEPLGLILDLGAHIGSTMAHFAVEYPGAKVVGVELDPDNAAICRRNIAAYGSRCVLEEGAVWSDDGRISFESGGEDTVKGHAVEDGGGESAPAISIGTLIDRHANGAAAVDFVKMDIEGAERTVLRENTAWAPRVRSLKVEVHSPYTEDECLADLRELGFRAWVSEPGVWPSMPVISAVRD